VTLTNTGNYDGQETAQLYIREMVGSVVRPVKELKGFQQVFLKAGESKQLSFDITTDDLSFYNDRLQHIFEPGDFVIMVGGNSRDVLSAKVNLGR
jgi:beta-glucosidase